MNNTPRPILYKYFPSERIDFFDTPRLRFTPAWELNDPFEGAPAFSGVLARQYIRQQKRKFEKKYPEIGSKPIRSKEAISEIMRKKLSVHLRKTLQKLEVGVASLTEENDNILMWSHYGENHKGLVVGFKTDHQFFLSQYVDEKRSSFRQVEYRKIRPTIHLQEAVSGFTDINAMLYTKSKLWEYEKEWRISVGGISRKPANEKPGLVPIPAEAVASVYIGLNASPEMRAKALSFCSKHNIEHLYQMKIHDTDFAVVSEQIPLSPPLLPQGNE